MYRCSQIVNQFVRADFYNMDVEIFLLGLRQHGRRFKYHEHAAQIGRAKRLNRNRPETASNRDAETRRPGAL
jgi:hypothetical protein